MTSLGTTKRGDSFSFTAVITDSETEDPIIGAEANLACDGRYTFDGDVIAAMTITETATPGTYLFTAGATDNWIPGLTISFDIEYTSSGVVSSSETLTLIVEEDYTYD